MNKWLDINSLNLDNKKKILSPQTRRLVWVIATTAMLILAWNKQISWETIEKHEEIAGEFYARLQEEMIYSSKWFIGTIIENNPEITSNEINKLRYQEKTTIHIFSIVSEEIKPSYFILNLSNENKNKISMLIPFLSRILDKVYWDWYWDVLTDWKDHSNKTLIIDVSLFLDKPYIRNLIIK